MSFGVCSCPNSDNFTFGSVSVVVAVVGCYCCRADC